jgi:DNA-binding response OmpR family regulator
MNHKKQILVAEHDTTLRELLEYLLQRQGYAVESVSDGEFAKRQLMSHKTYDLVILDLLLPIFSGSQLLKWLRDYETHRHMPVLILTDLQDDDDIADALDAGADDYMIKPFQPKELQARIRKLLRIKKD